MRLVRIIFNWSALLTASIWVPATMIYNLCTAYELNKGWAFGDHWLMDE